MCANYSLPPFDWLKLSHHLVSGESTLHEVTLFEARSRIFLPTAESCAALFCCRLAIRASSLGWLVGNKDLYRLVPSRYLIVFWDERRLGIRLRRARGVMGREEGKIATGRFRSLETCKCSQRRASRFFKDNGTFLVFFFLNILCDVYLFIINNKKVSKK